MSGSPSWFDWSSWTPTTLGSRWWIRIWEEMKLWKGIEYLSNKWTWIPLWDEHEYPSQKIGLRFISISSKFPSTLLYRLYNCCCAKIIVAINLLRDIKGTCLPIRPRPPSGLYLCILGSSAQYSGWKLGRKIPTVLGWQKKWLISWTSKKSPRGFHRMDPGKPEYLRANWHLT